MPLYVLSEELPLAVSRRRPRILCENILLIYQGCNKVIGQLATSYSYRRIMAANERPGTMEWPPPVKANYQYSRSRERGVDLQPSVQVMGYGKIAHEAPLLLAQ